MRWEKLQLMGFALFIEDLHGCQPARLRGTVQLAQVAERSLARAIRCAHRFNQRPIGVILAVLVATVRPQKHSELIVSRCRSHFQDSRSALHCCFQKALLTQQNLTSSYGRKPQKKPRRVDLVTNLGYARLAIQLALPHQQSSWDPAVGAALELPDYVLSPGATGWARCQFVDHAAAGVDVERAIAAAAIRCRAI